MTSDRRLKKNIDKFNGGLAEVLAMNPVTFEYNGQANTRNSKGQNIGVIAQELQQIAPYLVTERNYYDTDEEGVKIEGTEKTYLGVKTSEIQFVLINAIQEQQVQIDAKDKMIQDLALQVAQLKDMVEAIADKNPSTSEAELAIELEGQNETSLAQNIPNPFTSETTIKYVISEEFTNAEMRVFDMNGRLIHQEPITQSGSGVVNLSTRNMQSGTYSYSLVIDGKVSGTKSMVLTK